MHPKIEILLEWELDTIESYFRNGLQFHIEQIKSADDTFSLPKLSAKDLAIGAFGYFRKSILYELNALVEHYLLMGADNGAGLLSNSNLKRSRAECIGIIKDEYNIDISCLRGYKEIKELYSTVNAIKHRGGFDFTDFSKPIPEFKMVRDDIDVLKALKGGTYTFIKELVNAILLVKGK